MFLKVSEYAIKAAICISQESLNKRSISLNDIAREIDSPVAFTAKILQKLTKNNVIDSTRGAKGGFTISEKKLRETSIAQIVKITETKEIGTHCGLGLKRCDARSPCPIHNRYTEIRKALQDMLDNTTMYELACETNKGITLLKRG